MEYLKPRQALNKAFLKVKPNRRDIDRFKSNLTRLIGRINDTESEEYHKNLISVFLTDTYYGQKHYINTKGRNDLVIYNGPGADSAVGVIIETKKPTNKAEMISTASCNAKAFHELVLYYLRERITLKNHSLKHLIVTNTHEWFIFDAALFERLFAQNRDFVTRFTDFESGRLADTKTDFFYREIAAPFIAGISAEITYTYFSVQDYLACLSDKNQTKDHALIALYKLLSPEHLLKLPFRNDSNSLDRHFYGELLHIIGLRETKDGGRKLIERNPPGQRHSGSLLEDTVIQLESLDKLSRLDNPGQYGATKDERLFQAALELVITWINRMLFLKLLEAQLISYHNGDKAYAFLNGETVGDYDDLNSLFFQVLARRRDERNDDVKQPFEHVPYLNSSLFEPTEAEHGLLLISNLKDNKPLPLFAHTVLKDDRGKTRTGTMTTLAYLFAFLDAYDFGAEGGEDIQEDNKTLINASVLGLIFEKINGYRDGSFFTPGFITMYICRETIRRAVVQKFNTVKNWQCRSIEDVYEKIEDRHEANRIVNSLTVCDPAVGSGHFLVSALNELIAVKSDLKILQDRHGNRLKEYRVEVVNDELAVTDDDGKLFEYRPGRGERQAVQEALFHEKQTIIENCLFGVDINPNSVKICRLRLWIELLKNAYYINPPPESGGSPRTAAGELQTLPNIDINIKCGNSLVSRFPLDADLKAALKPHKHSIEDYRRAVAAYRNAADKEQKRGMERLIADVKSDLRSEIALRDPKAVRLRKLNAELFTLTNQEHLFDAGKKEQAAHSRNLKKLTEDVRRLTAEIDAIKANKIFEQAFEWRFEFPEVLNENGDFVGFDAVIGNPPYIQLQSIQDTAEQLRRFEYETFEKTGDIYSLFYEKGNQLLTPGGYLAYITSNKWLRAGYGKRTRDYLLAHTQPELLIDLGSGIFEEATVDTNILLFKKGACQTPFSALDVSREKQVADFYAYREQFVRIAPKLNESWIIASPMEQAVKAKIEAVGTPLKDWDVNIYRGVLTGYNNAFIIDAATKAELIAQDPNSADIIKPILRGRDIKRYRAEFADLWLIATFPALKLDIDHYPAVRDYLEGFGRRLHQIGEEYLDENGKKIKTRKKNGNKWFETQDQIAYYREFEKEKIVWGNLCTERQYAIAPPSLMINAPSPLINSGSRYLLAVLNSKLSDFYILKLGVKRDGGFFEYKPMFIEQLPIPRLSEADQEPFVSLVNEILAQKEAGKDTAALESQIDQLVYRLYGLTAEEIALIETDRSTA